MMGWQANTGNQPRHLKVYLHVTGHRHDNGGVADPFLDYLSDTRGWAMSLLGSRG